MPVRYFAQRINVDVDTSSDQFEGSVVDSIEITQDQYKRIRKNKEAVERGFEGLWHEAFMTLIQAIETIRDDYRQDAKETEDPEIEKELLSRKLVVERILLEAERIRECTEEK